MWSVLICRLLEECLVDVVWYSLSRGYCVKDTMARVCPVYRGILAVCICQKGAAAEKVKVFPHCIYLICTLDLFTIAIM